MIGLRKPYSLRNRGPLLEILGHERRQIDRHRGAVPDQEFGIPAVLFDLQLVVGDEVGAIRRIQQRVDPVRQEIVVAIENGDPRRGRRIQPPVARNGRPAIFLQAAEDQPARGLRLQRSDDGGRVIRGCIVDHDNVVDVGVR